MKNNAACHKSNKPPPHSFQLDHLEYSHNSYPQIILLGTDHYFLSEGYHIWDLQTIFSFKNAFQTIFSLHLFIYLRTGFSIDLI